LAKQWKADRQSRIRFPKVSALQSIPRARSAVELEHDGKQGEKSAQLRWACDRVE
jgi:hypothetical protein